jgi:hypothetical protein
LSATGKE